MSTLYIKLLTKFCTYFKIIVLLVLVLTVSSVKHDISHFYDQNNSTLLNHAEVINQISQNEISFAGTENVETPNSQNLRITAVNPGYTIDGVKNVGEFIEISKLSENLISLAGLLIIYTNSNGNSSVLYEFAEKDYFAGEALLLKLSTSPDFDQSDAIYSNQIAFSAGLYLQYRNETFSEVCWTGKENCQKSFNSKSPTVLIYEQEINSYQHVEEYSPNYEQALIKKPQEKDPEIDQPSECRFLEFSELLTYYEDLKEEQFLELYNNSSNTINISNCQIKYKNKIYNLLSTNELAEGDYLLQPQSYFLYRSESFTFTKNPTTDNKVEILDENNNTITTLVYYHGQKKNTSYAYFPDQKAWKNTYNITPGSPNQYQQFQTCEEGKVINEETGNCVKMDTIEVQESCPEGKYRNPETGRCKKYENDQELAACAAGYERNPETNRCRKVVSNDGEAYPVVPVTGDTNNKNLIILAVVVVAVILAIGYVIFQFRKDLKYSIKKLLTKKK